MKDIQKKLLSRRGGELSILFSGPMKCSVSVMTSDWGDSLDSSGHLTKLLLSRDSLWRVRLSSGLAVSFKVFI